MIDGNVEGKSLKGNITKIPQVDKTLSVAGQAAEAKATGEALDRKVDKASIADNLTTADASKVLSAKQGVDLKALIDAEAQKRKNAINTLQNETNVIIKGVNESIVAANGDIEELGNGLNTAKEDIAKNAEEIEEIKAQQGVFTYVGDGSTEKREIQVGLNCNGLLVKGGNTLVIIQGGTSAAVFCGGDTQTSATTVAGGGAYIDGKLSISPRSISRSEQTDEGYATWTEYYQNDCLNKDGYEYTCIPL